MVESGCPTSEWTFVGDISLVSTWKSARSRTFEGAVASSEDEGAAQVRVAGEPTTQSIAKTTGKEQNLRMLFSTRLAWI